MKRIIAAAISFALVVSLLGCGGGNSSAPEIDANYQAYQESLRESDLRNISAQDYSLFNTVATDDFGRTFVTVDGYDDTKYVGMFYFLCLGQNIENTGLYDVSVITDNGKNHAAFQVNDATSPEGAAHFWGEPVYGYYNSEDPWVLRKHIELLTMAGIDFLVFDVSNALTYRQVTDVLFPIMQEYYDAGWRVPKFMYYTAHDSGKGENKNTIQTLYNDYYREGKYKDLWFCPYEDGKPLITRHQNTKYEVGDEIGEFFHFRYRQWPTEAFNAEGTPWIEFTYPQPNHSGWMNASVATHAKTVRLSDLEANPGRGATWEGSGATAFFVNDSKNYRQGPHYEQQWDNIIGAKDEVNFAFLTGWNEWCATKMYDSANHRYFTVDQYNAEYSRDLEPTRTDGLGDNFYLQTIRKLREYNGEAARHYTYPKRTPALTGDDDVWKDVPTYMDFTGECENRDFKVAIVGNPRKKYTNATGRNDIESIKVTHDEENLYFRITTVDDITEYESGDTSWMNIWLSTANGAGSKLHGYNYVINRSITGNKTQICRTRSATDICECGAGETYVFGKTMLVRVPLSAIGLSADTYTLAFKVTDHISFETDYMNLYDTGDCAPCGRLNFSYGY